MNYLSYIRFGVSVVLMTITMSLVLSAAVLSKVYYCIAGLEQQGVGLMTAMKIFKEEFEAIKNNTLT